MAIHSSPSTPLQGGGVSIEAWNVAVPSAVNFSTSTSTGVTLSIPLDAESTGARAISARTPRKESAVRPGRDSMKGREAMLRGKEGSRRRQRWENDHLLHVPNAQPPLPSDWQVHSTSPINHVPYFLAPLWENGVRHRAEEIASAKKAQRSAHLTSTSQDTTSKGRVPPELRQKLKKSKGAKSLLQDLEEEVRKFVRDYERKERFRTGIELDSEDEEIVFVGRNGSMSDEQRKTVEEELEREKKVFDSLVGDQGGTFGRWLVHSLAAYYGLSSRSVTVGDPLRREAWVGMKAGREDVKDGELPRPLWGMI